MSKNGSKKEYIFNLILQRNPQLLSPIVGEIELIELEYDPNKRIDIFGRDLNHNSPIYVESQLGCSDEVHFEKIRKLIETNQNERGIFIWIASRFKDEHLGEIRNLFESHSIEKSITILAFSIQKGYLEMLDNLNQLRDLDIWKQINQKDFVLPELSLEQQCGELSHEFKNSTETVLNCPVESPSTIEINSYLLSTLRKEVPYLLNVHRSKKLTVNPIVFGLGVSDLSIVINLAASETTIRLENDWQSPLFQKIVWQFKCNEGNFETIVFEDKRIVFPIPELEDFKEKVDMTTKMFKKLVDVVIPTIYSL
ncbi:hypothetical protein ACFVAD_20840 [Sutcliffiella sp. NPDC057660]|uniref:hypothetical protein n=1 Tax=Sutcliffiella sp. NPDC057660 TaxID=3346199 RepID=UPI0036B5C12B